MTIDKSRIAFLALAALATVSLAWCGALTAHAQHRAFAVVEAARAAAQEGRAAAQEGQAAAPDARAVAAAKAREQQLDAQAQQYVQLMQPLMWRELEFVRQTCDLAPAQRPKIKAAAEAGVKQAARDMVMPRQAGRGRTPAGAGQVIREEVAKVLKEMLTAEQSAQYNAEHGKRREAEKRAAIASAVATMDTALYLNKEQRDKIVGQLAANWRDEWDGWLQLWQYGGQYYPQVPDNFVVPHLSDEQKTVWRGLQKVNVSSWGGHMQREATDDEWWEGKPQNGQQSDGEQAGGGAKADSPTHPEAAP
jgi:hypothetical protein